MLQRKNLLIISLLLLLLPAAALQAQDDTVVIAVGIEPVSMDAWRGFAETGGPGFLNAVEQLVTRDFESGEMVPLLATAWEWIDDRTIQFTLREGVSFHDGSYFNAAAAAASINHTFDPENAFDLLDFVGSMSAEAVGDYTLNVSTPEPDPILLNKMYFVPIGSAQQLMDDPDSYHTNLIGTGPYRFVEWSSGESITYEANPDWWGHGMMDEAGGEVVFQRAVYRFLPEDQVRTAAVQAGEAHIAQYITPEQCAEVSMSDSARCESAASVETIFIRMDTNSPMLGDVRVRRALQLGIDKDLIIETILGGTATATGQIVNDTALGHSPDISPYPYDPEEAAALLEAAAADGVPVDMEITLGARIAVMPGIDETLQAIASMWGDLGLNVSIEFFDPEGFGQVMLVNIKDVPEDRNFVAVHLHGQELLDYHISYRFYFSCDGILSVYCNDEAEALWNAAEPLAGAERDATLQQLNQVAHDDVAAGYIGHLDFSYAVSNALDWSLKLDHRLQAKEMSPAG